MANERQTEPCNGFGELPLPAAPVGFCRPKAAEKPPFPSTTLSQSCDCFRGTLLGGEQISLPLPEQLCRGFLGRGAGVLAAARGPQPRTVPAEPQLLKDRHEMEQLLQHLLWKPPSGEALVMLNVCSGLFWSCRGTD